MNYISLHAADGALVRRIDEIAARHLLVEKAAEVRGRSRSRTLRLRVDVSVALALIQGLRLPMCQGNKTVVKQYLTDSMFVWQHHRQRCGAFALSLKGDDDHVC